MHPHTERNNWCHALERDQCLAIVAVQIVEVINSSNNCSKFMRAAHSNLQTKYCVFTYKVCDITTFTTHATYSRY